MQLGIYDKYLSHDHNYYINDSNQPTTTSVQLSHTNTVPKPISNDNPRGLCDDDTKSQISQHREPTLNLSMTCLDIPPFMRLKDNHWSKICLKSPNILPVSGFRLFHLPEVVSNSSSPFLAKISIFDNLVSSHFSEITTQRNAVETKLSVARDTLTKTGKNDKAGLCSVIHGDFHWSKKSAISSSDKSKNDAGNISPSQPVMNSLCLISDTQSLLMNERNCSSVVSRLISDVRTQESRYLIGEKMHTVGELISVDMIVDPSIDCSKVVGVDFDSSVNYCHFGESVMSSDNILEKVNTNSSVTCEGIVDEANGFACRGVENEKNNTADQNGFWCGSAGLEANENFVELCQTKSNSYLNHSSIPEIFPDVSYKHNKIDVLKVGRRPESDFGTVNLESHLENSNSWCKDMGMLVKSEKQTSGNIYYAVEESKYENHLNNVNTDNENIDLDNNIIKRNGVICADIEDFEEYENHLKNLQDIAEFNKAFRNKQTTPLFFRKYQNKASRVYHDKKEIHVKKLFDKLPSYITKSVDIKKVKEKCSRKTCHITDCNGKSDYQCVESPSKMRDSECYLKGTGVKAVTFNKVPSYMSCFTNSSIYDGVVCETMESVIDNIYNITEHDLSDCLPAQNCVGNSGGDTSNQCNLIGQNTGIQQDEVELDGMDGWTRHSGFIEDIDRTTDETSLISRVQATSSNLPSNSVISRLPSRHLSRSDSHSRLSSSHCRQRSRSHSQSQQRLQCCDQSQHRLQSRKQSRYRRRVDSNPYNQSSNIRRMEDREDKHRNELLNHQERKIIYVGRLPAKYTHRQLRRHFSIFGEVTDTKLFFREKGDNYGFVTFRYTCDAYAAIEKGNDHEDMKFDLCFGGRRHFCQTSYMDLDNKDEEDNDEYHLTNKDVASTSLDFDSLLRQAQSRM